MRQKDKDYIIGLFPTIGKIKNVGIRDKVVSTWYSAWKRSNFKRIEDVHQFEPARDRIIYTNVEHTNQVCRACERIGEFLAKILNLNVQMDHLLAGAILHDVDKMIIFDAKTGRSTVTGRLLGHAMVGATMALMEGLPEEVAHIIGTHSFKFSAIQPKSIEALILRHVDELIADSAYLAQGLDLKHVLKQSMDYMT